MKHQRWFIGYKRLAAALAAFMICAVMLSAYPAAFAAPDEESEPLRTVAAEQDSERESGTIRGSRNASSSAKSSVDDEKTDENGDNRRTSASDKNADDEKEEEDEAEATPAPDPRVGENGRPILSENECAILVNTLNGEVMFEQNSNERVYPASTTKIMTALLTLEAIERDEINLNSAFLVMPEMLADLPADGSSMLLKEGEAITVEQLLQGLLVQSGNDAAQALAIVVCGDIPTFVQRMNDKAAELGLTGTNYVNTHGLHDDNQYTTAADLAKLTSEAMKHNTFREIVSTAKIVIPATNKTSARTFISTNGLLSTLRYGNYYYPNAIGVKTGHTSQAGYCLVAAAKEGDLEVVSVLMRGSGEDDRHLDSRNMLKYALDNNKAVTAVKKGDMISEIKVKFGSGTDHTTLSVDSDIVVTIPEDASSDDLVLEPQTADYIAAPVNAGDEIGTVNVVLDGKVVGSGKLIADNSVKRHPLGFLMQFFSFVWSFTAVRVIVIVLAAALLIFIVYMIINIRRNIIIAERRRRVYGKNSRRRR